MILGSNAQSWCGLDIPVTLGQVWLSDCATALHPQHTTDAGEMNLTCSEHSGPGFGSCRQQAGEGTGCGVTPGGSGAGMLFALRMRNKPEGENTVLVAAGAHVHTQAASRQSSKGDGNQHKILALCATAQVPGTKVLCKTETKPESDSE